MVKYSLIDPRNEFGRPTGICLVTHPKYGLQLPGGKVETGESFEECARRELHEETNYTPQDDIIQRCGIFTGDGFEVAIFMCPVHNARLPFGDHPVYWYNWDTVRVDRRLKPDLKIIVPMIREAPPGWHLRESPGGLSIAFESERAFQTH